MVNEGYQVFDKATGNSSWGRIASRPSGAVSAAPARTAAPATRSCSMTISPIAGSSLSSPAHRRHVPITDECVAVSTTADATGTYNRYGFHLGSNFFDYPHLSVWPDGYYMSMNVFNSAGTAYLGPQPSPLIARRCWRSPATFVSPVGPLGGRSTLPARRPRWLDLPPAGAPATFVGFPGRQSIRITRPIISTSISPRRRIRPSRPSPVRRRRVLPRSAPPLAPVCPVGCHFGEQLDGIGDRLMFRLAYRNFGDHESVVGNYTVSAGGVAACAGLSCAT